VLSGPGRRGRPPRILHKHAVLAMVLHFYTAAVEHKTLQELFGVPPTTFSRVMSNAEEALERSLRRMPDAAVRWPSVQQQQRWSELTNAKEPLVEGVFAFVDGKNYRVQAPSNAASKMRNIMDGSTLCSSLAACVSALMALSSGLATIAPDLGTTAKSVASSKNAWEMIALWGQDSK
ncbi:hypothetical protein As57867_004857, partial [Aphanomyces stellatus]